MSDSRRWLHSFGLASVGALTMLAATTADPAPVLCAGQWTKVADNAASPPARFDTRMAYDEARERVVLFGGQAEDANYTYLNDTWEWDGAAWAQVSNVYRPET